MARKKNDTQALAEARADRTRRPKADTSQFNIRLERWIIEDIKAIALSQSRKPGQMAKLLLANAVRALKGSCICHRATPGFGSSGMPCPQHGDWRVPWEKWHDASL